VDAKVDEILDEAQVTEVLSDGLNAIASSADAEKIRLLKNGVARSFTDAEMTYARKQHFLGLLRSLSSIEIAVLRAIYMRSDPYEIHETPAPPVAASPLSGITVGGLVNAGSILVAAPLGWRVKEWRHDDRIGPLLEVVAKACSEDPLLIRSAVGRLDQAGLLNAIPHLDEKQYRIMEPIASLGSLSGTFVNVMSASLNPNQRTPTESSRSETGRAFIDFCTRSTP
jgi:hypothetical protein